MEKSNQKRKWESENREEETTEKNKDRKEQMKLRRVKYFQFQQNLSFVSRIHDVC